MDNLAEVQRRHQWLRLITDSGEAPIGSDVMLGQLERIAEEVNAGDDIDDILQRIVTAITRNGPWTQCWTGLIDPASGETLAAFHSWTDDAGRRLMDAWPYDGSPCEAAIRTGDAVVIDDARTDPRFPLMSEQVLRTGYGSVIVVPIELDQAWALVEVSRADAHDFSELEVSLAKVIAAFAAIALRNVLSRTKAIEAERVTNSRLSRLNQIITEQNETLRRLSAVHDRLLHAQLRSGGVEAQCAEIGEVIGAPFLVFDRFAQLVSSARIGHEEAGELATAVGARWEELSTCGSRPRSITLEGRELLVSQAAQGGENLAVLVAAPPPGTAVEATATIVELAGLYIALEILRARETLDAEVRLQEDFAEALLALTGSESALSRHASMLGIRLDTPVEVVRAGVRGASVLDRRDAAALAALARRRLAERGVEAVVAPVGTADFVFVVAPARAGSRGIRDVNPVIRQVLRDGLAKLTTRPESELRIAIGHGSTGSGVAALRASHVEALRAVEVLRATGDDDGELSIGDAGSYALLTSALAVDRRSFVDRYLRALLAYDEVHGSGYLDTLRAYFASVGNIQRVAEELFLHISTVRYRLNRIEKIAHVSLRDEEDRLCLQLALRIAGLETRA